MKKFAIIVEIAGLVIMLLGFLTSKASQLSFVARILAPHYVAAKQGADALYQNGILLPDELGYKEFTDLVRRQLLVNHSKEEVSQMTFTQITYSSGMVTGSSMIDGEAGANPVGIYCAGQIVPMTWIRLNVDKAIEKMLQDEILIPSALIFGCGFTISVTGIILKRLPVNSSTKK